MTFLSYATHAGSLDMVASGVANWLSSEAR